jgi:LysR family hydrogen peroxide-inducible transcriptional activator
MRVAGCATLLWGAVGKDKQQLNLKSFETPEPAREVSMIYHQRKLKLHIIEALHDKIRAIIRGAIVYEDIKIISPK